MKVVRTISALQAEIKSQKELGFNVGLVPTMGFLHDGHMSLVARSKKETDFTVVSIYVNPSQFNESSDFDKYPRDEEGDLKQLEKNNCDLVFLPSKEEIELLELPVGVSLGDLDTVMEGEHRPGHFKGVYEVVYRLFSAVKPDLAFFGEKDFQQIMVIKKMVEDTNFPVQIVSCPILREESGLAMSSRNVRLSDEGKARAALIFQVLQNSNLENEVEKAEELNNLGFEVEYIEKHSLAGENRLFIAAWLEGVRLIDNIAID